MINQTKDYEFCIIVPIYNEEENIDALEKAFSDYLKESSVRTCVLFVNDGSSDASRMGIERICAKHQGFYYLSFTRNNGLSAAIKAGIDATESPFIGYIDADLQTIPEDFELLLPHRKDFQLVTGIRTGRKDSLGKRLSSKFANSFRRMMTGDNAIDTGCPLKVMQAETAKQIPFFKGLHRFIPAMVMLQEGIFKQIPVRHFERKAGTSKFHLWNRLTGPFLDCFAYRWMKKRYIHYVIERENLLTNNQQPNG